MRVVFDSNVLLAALLFPEGRAAAAVGNIDEPDNRIPECAAEGKADVIVTGDKAMLALVEYKGVRLISPAGLL